MPLLLLLLRGPCPCRCRFSSSSSLLLPPLRRLRPRLRSRRRASARPWGFGGPGRRFPRLPRPRRTRASCRRWGFGCLEVLGEKGSRSSERLRLSSIRQSHEHLLSRCRSFSSSNFDSALAHRHRSLRHLSHTGSLRTRKGSLLFQIHAFKKHKQNQSHRGRHRHRHRCCSCPRRRSGPFRSGCALGRGLEPSRAAEGEGERERRESERESLFSIFSERESRANRVFFLFLACTTKTSKKQLRFVRRPPFHSAAAPRVPLLNPSLLFRSIFRRISFSVGISLVIEKRTRA